MLVLPCADVDVWHPAMPRTSSWANYARWVVIPQARLKGRAAIVHVGDIPTGAERLLADRSVW